MAAKLNLGGFTLYADDPPPVARMYLSGFSIAQPTSAPSAPAKIYLGGFSIAQPLAARLEVVWWDGAWRLTDEYLWWEGSWVPAPGNTT